MEPHHLANIFPMMGKDEYEFLKKDIKDNGLIVPITTSEGKVLDGRNRLKACEELKIKPTFKEFQENGISKLDFIVVQNLSRRNLGKSQLACVAVEFNAKIVEDRKKKASQYKRGDGRTREILESIFGVGQTTIMDASLLLKRSPKLFSEAKSGLLSVDKALMLSGSDRVAKHRQYLKAVHCNFKPSLRQMEDSGWNWEAISEVHDGVRSYCYHFHRKGIPAIKDWNDEPFYETEKLAVENAVKEARARHEKQK